MIRYLVVFLIILVVSIISGCATIKSQFGPEKSLFGGNRVTVASANQMIDEDFEGFTDEELVHLLHPENPSLSNWGNLTDQDKMKALNTAIKNANQYSNTKAHRSQIQDRLIAASNQRCNVYATYLKRMSTQINGVLGTLTTALGGAGAIVTGAEAARILAGLAGIASGTRGELNQAIFESVTTSVIVPAFQNRREEILTEIMSKRLDDLEKYTIEGAMADAIKYHGACSLDAGISFAQKSIQSFDDIGVKKLKPILDELGLVRSVSESFIPGSLNSVVVSKKVLGIFVENLTKYKSSINQSKPELVKEIEAELGKATSTDGDYLKEAEELDKTLAGVLLNLSSSTGIERRHSTLELQTQQINAENFQKKISVKKDEILSKMNK